MHHLVVSAWAKHASHCDLPESSSTVRAYGAIEIRRVENARCKPTDVVASTRTYYYIVCMRKYDCSGSGVIHCRLPCTTYLKGPLDRSDDTLGAHRRPPDSEAPRRLIWRFRAALSKHPSLDLRQLGVSRSRFANQRPC